MPQQPKKVKTAKNVFTIIEKIDALDQPTCTELSEHVDLSISSIYNYLHTLKSEGYIIEKNGRYRLSLKFLQMGRSIRNSYPILKASVEPIDILSNSINEYISVFIKEGNSVVMIHEANGHHAVHVPAPFLGEPFSMLKTPQGKAILAHATDSFSNDILASEDLNSETMERLRTELETIRNRGLLIDEGQAHENIWAVAAPVVVGGEVHGSVMISTVLHRLDENRANREIPYLLALTIKEVEHRLSRYNFDSLYSNW